MRKYENKTITSNINKLISIKCDICGELHGSEWKKKNNFDVKDTTVMLRTGTSYPEHSFGENITIDICPDCFCNKLVPWVESQGGEPRKEEWEY